jgi:hypothetical protein
MVPVLHEVLGRKAGEVRTLFEARGMALHDWAHARTDRIVVGVTDGAVLAASEARP